MVNIIIGVLAIAFVFPVYAMDDFMSTDAAYSVTLHNGEAEKDFVNRYFQEYKCEEDPVVRTKKNVKEMLKGIYPSNNTPRQFTFELCPNKSKVAIIDTLSSRLIVFDTQEKKLLHSQHIEYIPQIFAISPSADTMVFIKSLDPVGSISSGNKKNHNVVVKDLSTGCERYFGFDNLDFIPRRIDCSKQGIFFIVRGIVSNSPLINCGSTSHYQIFPLHHNISFPVKTIYF